MPTSRCAATPLLTISLTLLRGTGKFLFRSLILIHSSTRNYIPCIYLLNKIDQISIEELEIITKVFKPSLHDPQNLHFIIALFSENSFHSIFFVVLRFPTVSQSLHITNGTTTAFLRRCGIIWSWYYCNKFNDSNISLYNPRFGSTPSQKGSFPTTSSQSSFNPSMESKNLWMGIVLNPQTERWEAHDNYLARCTVEDFCNKIHRTIINELKWGIILTKVHLNICQVCACVGNQRQAPAYEGRQGPRSPRRGRRPDCQVGQVISWISCVQMNTMKYIFTEDSSDIIIFHFIHIGKKDCANF